MKDIDLVVRRMSLHATVSRDFARTHSDGSASKNYHFKNADLYSSAVDIIFALHKALERIANSDESAGTLRAIARTALDKSVDNVDKCRPPSTHTDTDTDTDKKERNGNHFPDFWASYPKKKSKGTAEKAWSKLKPTDDLVAEIAAGLERAKTSADWVKDGGKFIPHPATWLNARGWEDEQEQDNGISRTSGPQSAVDRVRAAAAARAAARGS